MNIRIRSAASLFIALLAFHCGGRKLDADLINNPPATLLEDLFGNPVGNLINADYNTSLNRGWTYAQAFTPTETLGFGDALSIQYWGGTATTPTPASLDFQFRILVDRPDGQAPSSASPNLYTSSGGSIHSFRQVRDLTASGTHTLSSAPGTVNTVWNEYNSFINVQQTLNAGTQYWLEILEFDSETVEDVNEFHLLPSTIQGANADQRRASFTPVTWFGSRTAAFRVRVVPEPASMVFLVMSGSLGLLSRRLSRFSHEGETRHTS